MKNMNTFKKLSIKYIAGIMTAVMAMSPAMASFACPITVYADDEVPGDPSGDETVTTEASLGDNPANGDIPAIEHGDTMNKNDGTIGTNAGAININNGTVFTNEGNINTNNGTITSNAASGVVTNQAQGVITTNAGTALNYGNVETNNGTVYNYGGTVTTNNGNHYFSVALNASNVTSQSSGLTSAYDKSWIANVGSERSTATYTITPATDYEIDSVVGSNPDFVTVVKNDDGTWTITVTSGANTTINVNTSEKKKNPPEEPKNPEQPAGGNNNLSEDQIIESFEEDIKNINNTVYSKEELKAIYVNLYYYFSKESNDISVIRNKTIDTLGIFLVNANDFYFNYKDEEIRDIFRTIYVNSFLEGLAFLGKIEMAMDYAKNQALDAAKSALQTTGLNDGSANAATAKAEGAQAAQAAAQEAADAAAKAAAAQAAQLAQLEAAQLAAQLEAVQAAAQLEAVQAAQVAADAKSNMEAAQAVLDQTRGGKAHIMVDQHKAHENVEEIIRKILNADYGWTVDSF